MVCTQRRETQILKINEVTNPNKITFDTKAILEKVKVISYGELSILEIETMIKNKSFETYSYLNLNRALIRKYGQKSGSATTFDGIKEAMRKKQDLL